MPPPDCNDCGPAPRLAADKLYSLLLKLYPEHFRRACGDEALRLVLDRARDEKGFLRGLRLWLDLLWDLVRSLPREYSKAPAARVRLASPVNGHPSFQLLPQRSTNPVLLCLACLLTAALFWTCVIGVSHSRIFPARFPSDSNSLQSIVQSDLALAQSGAESAAVGVYSFCVTARRDIPGNSLRPLLSLNFASPGASGSALLDGRIVSKFKKEQHLWISADVSAGKHWFVVQVDRPAENTSLLQNADFKDCPAQQGVRAAIRRMTGK